MRFDYQETNDQAAAQQAVTSAAASAANAVSNAETQGSLDAALARVETLEKKLALLTRFLLSQGIDLPGELLEDVP